ncbi:sphingomyelin phosphodiesterase 5-like [Pelobates cultripes]|uniref:sphingomyelin phosphodiesterase n=1 Tax=Pelobates cultripes TaxID=61616 RepID=A0AAD1RZU9_PELCU|nr:sphingomyelin phosphodiesterase 5-like [Pelobates cultripes]
MSTAPTDSLALYIVQVQVGITEEKQRIVGYFNCTHLHAPEQDASIRCEQMSFVLRWVSEFQTENRETGDIICFDILCGDLNFDNCSLDDTNTCTPWSESTSAVGLTLKANTSSGPRYTNEQWCLYLTK